MYQYVALTDGTTLLDLTDGGTYALVSYAPAVSVRNDNELGPLYADVQETITFHAIGCTAADAYAAAAAVNTLLDQARRWRDGEPVAAVVLIAAPQGTTRTTPLRAIVRGRAPGGPTNVALPATYNATLNRYIIQNITIQFTRAGLWLDPNAESTTITAAAANPTVQTANFASSLSLAGPTTLTCNFLTGGVYGNSVPTIPAFVLWASSAARLQIYEAEAGFFVGNVASQADAANLARGGSVARYSPGALTATILITLAGFDSTSRRLALWAPVRNNSATTIWTIQPDIIYVGRAIARGQITVIDTQSTKPRMQWLGMVTSRQPIQAIRLNLTASAASGTMDIDYLVVQAVDDEGSGAIGVLGSLSGLAGNDPVMIDPSALTLPTPLVLDGGYAAGYTGDPFVMTKGQSYAAVWLATSDTFWRTVNGVNALMDTQFTASRLASYLLPG